jgi:hypothetical protein
MPLVGSFPHTFTFTEFGGTNNLLPGRPLEQSVPFTPPRGAASMAVLRGFGGAFIHPNQTLTQRPLGQFVVSVGLKSGSLVCRVRLTDENMDDPISIWVQAYVAFIT